MPALDCAYKLVAYAGTPRRKRSEGKELWPGAKQVYRRLDTHGRLDSDVLQIPILFALYKVLTLDRLDPLAEKLLPLG